MNAEIVQVHRARFFDDESHEIRANANVALWLAHVDTLHYTGTTYELGRAGNPISDAEPRAPDGNCVLRGEVAQMSVSVPFYPPAHLRLELFCVESLLAQLVGAP